MQELHLMHNQKKILNYAKFKRLALCTLRRPIKLGHNAKDYASDDGVPKHDEQHNVSSTTNATY